MLRSYNGLLTRRSQHIHSWSAGLLFAIVISIYTHMFIVYQHSLDSISQTAQFTHLYFFSLFRRIVDFDASLNVAEKASFNDA